MSPYSPPYPLALTAAGSPPFFPDFPGSGGRHPGVLPPMTSSSLAAQVSMEVLLSSRAGAGGPPHHSGSLTVSTASPGVHSSGTNSSHSGGKLGEYTDFDVATTGSVRQQIYCVWEQQSGVKLSTDVSSG